MNKPLISEQWSTRIIASAWRLGNALGIAGLIGLVAGVCIIGAGLLEVSRQKQLLDTKLHQLYVLQKGAVANPASIDREQQKNQLQEYRRTFPAADQLHLIWPSIEQLARQEQIQLEQAAFHQATNDAAGFGRVEVSLPLKSAYLPLKRFLAAVMNQHKTVAIEVLTMERAKVSTPVFDVNLRLVLYYSLAGEGR